MKSISIRALFLSFLRMGATAFGGGMAALPIFEAELVRRRGWLSTETVAELYALAQAVPGVILVNFAVSAGARLKGRCGAAVAVLAVILPAFILILCVAAAMHRRSDARWVQAIFMGLQLAVVALMASAALRLARQTLRVPLALGAVAGLTLLMLATRVNPIIWILGGAAIGALFAHRAPAAPSANKSEDAP